MRPHHVKLISGKDLHAGHFVAEFKETIAPWFEPAADATEAQIDQLLDGLGCLHIRPSSNAKLRVLLSSFLLQAQRLQHRVDRKGGSLLIGWPHDESYWRIRSKVGYKVAKKLREALVEHGWMAHAVKAERDLIRDDGNCHGYLISDDVIRKGAGLQFQSNRDLIYATKIKHKGKAVNIKVDKAIDKRTEALWGIWGRSPLTYGDQKMSVATRTFGDKALKKGGRFYGPWTTMPKAQRLQCTIDGRQVAEVDITASHPTLLMSISGKAPFQGEFTDPYQIPSLDGIDRGEIKAVINSAIGAGKPVQTQQTRLTRAEGIGKERLADIRKIIIPAYKCLDVLRKKDSKDEFYSEHLAWHEAEIMMRVVETLQQPIFILHDCLICQRDIAKDVGLALQDTFLSYCQENGWTPVKPAFTIEYMAGGPDRNEGEFPALLQ
jgi:hypothetical protein